MEKTYWWRLSIVFGSIMILLGAYAGPCEYNIGRCIGGNSILLTRTLFHFSLALFAISPFLFFINDVIFKKWLRFGVAWFFLAAVLIFISPEYSGGFGPSLNPTKESVSIWMSSLFVIISLILIVREALKMKR